ncbi:hypothetical protein SAMN05216550_14016 [Paraburkholderia tropica]|uniref:Uncharacterized protein n=1 Tax=Paraburkholderia tropica TaxID=92647 RepID=A0AAQ1GPP2_9BURK|nr:hypothetical protein SAMN05216550_14016 [Paraburkholderia tropica]
MTPLSSGPPSWLLTHSILLAGWLRKNRREQSWLLMKALCVAWHCNGGQYKPSHKAAKLPDQRSAFGFVRLCNEREDRAIQLVEKRILPCRARFLLRSGLETLAGEEQRHEVFALRFEMLVASGADHLDKLPEHLARFCFAFGTRRFKDEARFISDPFDRIGFRIRGLVLMWMEIYSGRTTPIGPGSSIMSSVSPIICASASHSNQMVMKNVPVRVQSSKACNSVCGSRSSIFVASSLMPVRCCSLRSRSLRHGVNTDSTSKARREIAHLLSWSSRSEGGASRLVCQSLIAASYLSTSWSRVSVLSGRPTAQR